MFTSKERIYNNLQAIVLLLALQDQNELSNKNNVVNNVINATKTFLQTSPEDRR